jgi:hypothetical protein
MIIAFFIYLYILLVGFFLFNIKSGNIYFFQFLNTLILNNSQNDCKKLFLSYYFYHNYGYKRFILEDCDEPHNYGWTWFRFTERASRRLRPKKPKDAYRRVFFFGAVIASYLYICLVLTIIV